MTDHFSVWSDKCKLVKKIYNPHCRIDSHPHRFDIVDLTVFVVFHVTINADVRARDVLTAVVLSIAREQTTVVLFLPKSPHKTTWAGDDFNNESTWSFC